MAIHLRKVGAYWAVSVRGAEVRCQDLAWAALSAMDLAEKLELPVELGEGVPPDALKKGKLLREELRARQAARLRERPGAHR